MSGMATTPQLKDVISLWACLLGNQAVNLRDRLQAWQKPAFNHRDFCNVPARQRPDFP